MNIDFKKPNSVKELIHVLDEQLENELAILHDFKNNIDHIFINDDKLEKQEFETILHNYYHDAESETYQYETSTILNMIYDYYARFDKFLVRPSELKLFIEQYTKEDMTKTYQLDVTSMTAPLTVTVYPDEFDKKLEIRKHTHNAIQIITFDKDGHEINLEKK